MPQESNGRFGSKAAAQVRLDISISMSASGVKQPLATHRMKLILCKPEIIQGDAPECLLFQERTSAKLNLEISEWLLSARSGPNVFQYRSDIVS